MEDHITALSDSLPAIIENVVAGSQGKEYFSEFGPAKAEKIKMMASELLESMIGYLKTANLDHARNDMKKFQENTPSTDSGSELKALWSDIIAAATLVNPASSNLLRQVWGVFDRLINESDQLLAKKNAITGKK